MDGERDRGQGGHGHQAPSLLSSHRRAGGTPQSRDRAAPRTGTQTDVPTGTPTGPLHCTDGHTDTALRSSPITISTPPALHLWALST